MTLELFGYIHHPKVVCDRRGQWTRPVIHISVQRFQKLHAFEVRKWQTCLIRRSLAQMKTLSLSVEKTANRTGLN